MAPKTVCNKAPRCVKSDKIHSTNKCDKPKEQKPYCVNCKGKHRASSTQCIEYIKKLEFLQKKHAIRNNQNQQKINPGQLNSKDFPIPNWTTNNATQEQASTSSNDNKTAQQTLNEFQQIKEEIDN